MKKDTILIYPVLVSAFVLCLYLPSVGSGFVWDELNVLSGHSAFVPFYEFDFHRPLFQSLLVLERALFGTNALFYHLVNQLLHAANAFMVFILAGRLLKSRTAGIVSALLFALHPANSEAVAWVFAGSELLKTFFMLVSMLLYLMYGEDRKPAAIIASALFYLLACLAGQGALLLPLAFLAYEVLIGEGLKKRLIHLSVFAAVGILYLIAFGGEGEILSVPGTPSFDIYNAFVSLGFYSIKLICPAGLTFLPAMPGEPYYLVIALALVSLPFLLKKEWRADKSLVLFILIMLLPPVLVSMSGDTHSLGIRYLYPASAGFSILAGYHLSKIPKRGLLIAAVVLLSGVFATATLQRAYVWGNRADVWAEAAKYNRGDSLININLSAALIAAGRVDEARKPLNLALSAPGISTSEFRRAMRLLYEIFPGNGEDMYENLSEIKGTTKAALGMGFFYFDMYSESEEKDKDVLRKAIKYLAGSAEADPDLILARYYLGLSYIEDGDMVNAAEEFEAVEALDATGRYASDAQYYLGLIKKLRKPVSGGLHIELK